MVNQLPDRTLLFFLFLLAGWGLSAQSYTMDGSPVDDCQGYFLDSGGANGDYGPNENFTTTICSDGTEGTHIQLLFSGLSLGDGDAIAFFDADTADPAAEFDLVLPETPGQPFIIQATAANNSGCITVVFTSDDTSQGAGWSAEINCTVACQIIFADLVSTTPAVMPVDTGWIDICPGDRVFFDGEGVYPQNNLVYNHSDLTCSFEWDFGNGNTAVGPTVTNVFNDPGGYIVQLTITDQFGCRNTNFLSQRVRVSTPPDYQLGGTLDQTLCVGDTIHLNALVDTLVNEYNVSVVPTEGAFFQEGIRSDTLLLPDGTGGVYSSSVGFNQFPPGATLTNPDCILGVTLDMEHSYGGDLDIELICPDGSSIFILDYPSGVGSTNFGEPWATGGVDGGGSTDLTPGIPYTYTFVNSGPGLQTLPQAAGDFNYTYTTVPSVNTGITHTYSDSYFPEGEYLPVESFSGLVGCPLNGEWTIRVTDNLGLDNGWLFEWSIAFCPELFAVLETFTPTFVDWGWDVNPSVFYSDQDSLAASPVNAGSASYTFWVEDDFGCVNDTTLNFTILPPSHPDCYSCDQQITEQADVIICEDESVPLDVSSLVPAEQPVTFESLPVYSFGASNHPPANPYRSTINVNSIFPGFITDPLTQIESICVDIETDWDADINIILESPLGLLFELSTGNGGAGDNYTQTCFTPDAMTPIQAGSPPFTGNFRPEGNWANLVGSPTNGNWTLRVSDAFGVNQMGVLNSWSITFNSFNQVTYSWSPSAGLSCDDCPNPVASPTSTTAYEVDITDTYGCAITDTILVGVVADIPPPNVSCAQIDQEVVFSWDPIPGFTSYEINYIINGVPTGWQGPYDDIQYIVPDLNNGDEVTLEVRVYFNSPADCPIPSGDCTTIYSQCGLAALIDEVIDVSCFGSTDGGVNLNILGGEAPFEIQVDGAGPIFTDPQITGLAAGPHTVTITDNQSCIFEADFTVASPDSLAVAAIATDSVSCLGSSNGILLATPTGGTENYTISWTGPVNG
ncbi:MAG: proprotein convertase P-domain-containing protein, partial [Lewinella sp.]|nr:proprotein convertase P-domain-containing protein [Lewinella sp.]